MQAANQKTTKPKKRSFTLRGVPDDVWETVLKEKQDIEKRTKRGNVSLTEAWYSLIRKV